MSDFLTRMIDEEKQLSEKCEKLDAFVSNGQPNFMDNQDWDLLKDQAGHMQSYKYILNKRIAKAQSKQLACVDVNSDRFCYNNSIKQGVIYGR